MVVYQDENDRPHRVRVAENFLVHAGIIKMNFPWYSPDLNPIEHSMGWVGEASRKTTHLPMTVKICCKCCNWNGREFLRGSSEHLWTQWGFDKWNFSPMEEAASPIAMNCWTGQILWTLISTPTLYDCVKSNNRFPDTNEIHYAVKEDNQVNLLKISKLWHSIFLKIFECM